jgi:hypothetical protein
LKKVAKNDNDIFFNSNWIKIVQYYKKYLDEGGVVVVGFTTICAISAYHC